MLWIFDFGVVAACIACFTIGVFIGYRATVRKMKREGLKSVKA